MRPGSNDEPLLQTLTKPADHRRRLSAQHGPLRKQALIDIPPERDQQLSRQGDDAEFPNPAIALPELLLVPARELTLRLKAQPRPRRVDRESADPPVAGLRNPLFMLQVATLIGRPREPRESADLAASPKLAPREELHDIEPCAIDADATELIQLPHASDRRIISDAQQRAPLVLEGADSRRVGLDRVPFAREPSAQQRRQRRAIPSPRRAQMTWELAQLRERNALTSEEAMN